MVVVAITHVADDRMCASSRVAAWLNRIAGRILAAFGVKLALGEWRYFTERLNFVPRISSSSGPASVALMRSSPIVMRHLVAARGVAAAIARVCPAPHLVVVEAPQVAAGHLRQAVAALDPAFRREQVELGGRAPVGPSGARNTKRRTVAR